VYRHYDDRLDEDRQKQAQESAEPLFLGGAPLALRLDNFDPANANVLAT
jgi:hypothetical protein